MKNIIVMAVAALLLAGCSGGSKKILIMSKGKATIDKDNKTITASNDGNSHEEETIEYNTSDKISLKVKSPVGETTVDIPENGYYILNIKPDTIVGAYQVYGAPKTETTVVTQEKLKQNIDSLKQLVANQNISAANRNYFILPDHAVKVTNNTDATIVGPFRQLPSIDKGDKEPEVYRFFSIKEVHEQITKLEGFTKAKEEQ